MPAPASALVTALRAGTAARHIFVRLQHSQGDVLAWDGIGEFVFGGRTFKGIAGFVALSGISDSADLQNHAVELKLNGVPQSNLSTIDPSIRGDICDVHAVWIQENGTVLDSKLLFSGKGSQLKVAPGDTDFTLIARIGALVADWSFTPRSFYSDFDQKRLFAGDTGCAQVAFLENASITGWAALESDQPPYLLYDDGVESSALPIRPDIFLQPGTRRNIGNHTHGLNVSSFYGGRVQASDASTTYMYKELGTGIDAYVSRAGSPITIDGVALRVDANGDVRTANGRLVASSNVLDATRRLRVCGAIPVVGAATAEQVMGISFPASPNTLFKAASGVVSGIDMTGLIFEEGGPSFPVRNSTVIEVVSGTTLQRVFNEFTGGAYAEQGSGWQVVFNFNTTRMHARSGAGSVGAPCVMSANGAVLGPNGGKIMPTTAGATGFLRKWT